MKTIILLSAGLLILVVILIAWRLYNSTNSHFIYDKKKVTIHLKAVLENGKKRLKLCDSNGNTATDHLITEVAQGATITWVVKTAGKIEKIDTIKPKISPGLIFMNNVERIGDKKIKLLVPVNVKPGTQEGYIIIFKHIDGDTVEIDPYIRIED